MIDLFHPELERTITVPVSVARVYRRSGWVDVVTATPDPVLPEGPQEADHEQGD